jgi:hypothetical protein
MKRIIKVTMVLQNLILYQRFRYLKININRFGNIGRLFEKFA